MYFLLFFGFLATIILFLAVIMVTLHFAARAHNNAKQMGINTYLPTAWGALAGLLVSFFIVILYFAFLYALKLNPKPMVCMFFSGQVQACEEQYGQLPSAFRRR